MIKGVDISHHQGAVDFEKLAKAGNVFSISKADEGVFMVDAQFKRSRIEAKKAGLIFGSYHFFHPTMDVDLQVKHYVNTIGPAQAGELPPVLDWETADRGLLSKAVQKARALKFCQEIMLINGTPPMVYASPGFLEDYGDLSDFERFPLWIAHYGVNHPRIPAPWQTYKFWQYADKNGMDLDLFNGSLSDLQAFVGLVKAA